MNMNNAGNITQPQRQVAVNQPVPVNQQVAVNQRVPGRQTQAIQALQQMAQARQAANNRVQRSTDEMFSTLGEALIESENNNQTLSEQNVQLTIKVNDLKNNFEEAKRIHKEEIQALKDQNKALNERVDDLNERMNDLFKKVTDNEKKTENLTHLYGIHAHRNGCEYTNGPFYP